MRCPLSDSFQFLRPVKLHFLDDLARTNIQLDDVAAELERRRIGYTSSDAIKDVYEYFIYTDVISYLRLINGSWKVSDLLQVLNKPIRYLREIDFPPYTES